MTEGKRYVKQTLRPLRLSLDERILLLFWWSRSLEKLAWQYQQFDMQWPLTRGGAFDGPAGGGAGLVACTGLAGGGGGRDGGASPSTSMADGSTGFGGGGLGLGGAGSGAAALGPVGIGRLIAGEWFCFIVNQYQVARRSRHGPISSSSGLLCCCPMSFTGLLIAW